jgi:hypothetical protein
MSETVFMVMPFGDSIADNAYRLATKPIVESMGLKILRADEIFSANPIFDDIVTAIEQAAIVIVDISGRNANCFYELGMAHTLKRSRTIMVTHDHFDETPFDIAHFRIIKYQDSIAGKQHFEENLRKTLKTILSGLSEILVDEFKLVSRILKTAGKTSELFGILGLAKSNRPIAAYENFFSEGSYGPASLPSAAHGGHCLDHFRTTIDLGYVRFLDGNLALTDKGKTFAQFLSSAGFKIDRFCDQVFTENYTSVFDKLVEQSKKQAAALNIPIPNESHP